MLRRRLYSIGGVEIPFAQVVAGDILCSDNTVVSAANYIASGKTAIAVVFYRDINYFNAVSLASANRAFGGHGTDIEGLDNITTEQGAIADLNGQVHTNVIYSAFPAIETSAKYCKDYSTAGTSAGDWYCGSIGELYRLGQNISAVNTTRTALSASSIFFAMSSTEYDASYYWYIYITSGVAIYHDDYKYSSYTPTYPIIKKTF